MLSPVQTRPRPEPANIPDRLEDFLRLLGAPTWFECPGRKSAPPRVALALLHGNEPSGAHAVHCWLRSGHQPAVDSFLFIASVQTALHPPAFSNRMLPGQPDANRVFQPPFDGPVALAAQSILARLERLEPQALVDLHNNTGRNPPYGVGCGASNSHLNLTRLFADRYMNSDLNLGALIEVTAHQFPSVAIECGKAGEPGANAVAVAGLERFLGAPDLALQAAPRGVQVLSQPIRVRVRRGHHLAFGHKPKPGANLTLCADVDRHNFGSLPAGTAIGWCAEGERLPLLAENSSGKDVTAELFVSDGGTLRNLRPMVPTMMTLDERVATSDCLFYAMLDFE